MSSMSLVEMTLAANEVVAAILADAEGNGGEINPVFEELLSRLKTGIVAKVDAIKFIRDHIQERAIYFARQQEIFRRASRAMDSADSRLSEALLESMDILKKDEIRGDAFRFTKQKNASPKLTYPVEWEAAPPEGYVFLEPTLYKAKLREDLESGKEVAGAKLLQGYHLRAYVNKGD